MNPTGRIVAGALVLVLLSVAAACSSDDDVNPEGGPSGSSTTDGGVGTDGGGGGTLPDGAPAGPATNQPTDAGLPQVDDPIDAGPVADCKPDWCAMSVIGLQATLLGASGEKLFLRTGDGVERTRLDGIRERVLLPGADIEDGIVDATHVYVSRVLRPNAQSAPTGTEFVQLPHLGGSKLVLSTEAPYARALAVGGGYLYFSAPTSGNNREIRKVPITSGASSVVVASTLQPVRAAFHQDKLYWLDDGGIWSVGTSGGSPESVAAASPPGAIDSLQIEGGVLFWIEGGNAVKQRTLPSGTPGTLSPATNTYSLVADGTNVYFTSDPDINHVMVVPRAGGTATKFIAIPAVGKTAERMFLAGGNLVFAGAGAVRRRTL